MIVHMIVHMIIHMIISANTRKVKNVIEHIRR